MAAGIFSIIHQSCCHHPEGPLNEGVTAIAIKWSSAEILHVYKGVYECS